MKKAILGIIFKKNRKNWEFLLLKRIPSRGGFWQPVSGRVEKNENPLQAVKRETIEETGIKQFKRIIKDVYLFKLEEEPNKTSYVFGIEIDSSQKINLDANIYPEHDKIKWCKFDEAIKLLKWPHNKEGLKKLYKILRD